MPSRTVSNDLKARIPVLRRLGYNVATICTVLGVRKSLVYKTLTLYHTTGLPFNPHASQSRTGRPRHIFGADITFIIAYLAKNKTAYIDELQHALAKFRGKEVSFSTLVRTLRRLHFSHKKVTVEARERNDLLRAAFMNRVGSLVHDPSQLLFTDESAWDARTNRRRMGWSLLGMRCVERQCFVRGERFSILPVLTLDGMVAWIVVEGAVTSEIFVQFLREHVVRHHSCSTFSTTHSYLQVPLMHPYPGPRSVLVLDNCNIHHAEEVRALIEDEAGTSRVSVESLF
jgi:transposase